MAPTLADLRRAASRPPSEHHGGTPRWASVAAVFTDDLDLLFIRRAAFEGDPWSGHISFPGGRMEEVDPDPLATAIRETREELGLDLEAAELLGRLDDVSPVSGLPQMAVRPYVFRVDRLPALAPNEEVHSTLMLSLDDLLAGHGRGTMLLDWKGQQITLPRVDFAGQRLWGMTLRMVDDLLHRLDGRGIGLARNRLEASSTKG